MFSTQDLLCFSSLLICYTLVWAEAPAARTPPQRTGSAASGKRLGWQRRWHGNERYATAAMAKRFGGESATVSISSPPLNYSDGERGRGGGGLFAVWVNIHLPPAVKREVNQSDYASQSSASSSRPPLMLARPPVDALPLSPPSGGFRASAPFPRAPSRLLTYIKPHFLHALHHF